MNVFLFLPLTGAEVFSEGPDVVLDLRRIKAGGDGIFLK